MENLCPMCGSKKSDKWRTTARAFPRWKTKVKGSQWECKYCGFVKRRDK